MCEDRTVQRPLLRHLVLIAAAAPLLATVLALAVAPQSAPASPDARAAVHYACSAPNSAHVPCHFATPSGNIRCLWTPHPALLECERVASRRGFRMHPTGRVQAIHLNLKRRGETLPPVQEIVFPQSLSCRDTARTMICNQDFGDGVFRLGPSHP